MQESDETRGAALIREEQDIRDGELVRRAYSIDLSQVPFADTMNELIALAAKWEDDAQRAQDPMERVVLNVCASQLQAALGV